MKMRNQLSLALRVAGARANMYARFCAEQTDGEPGAFMEVSPRSLSGSHCSHRQPMLTVAEGWGSCVPEAGRSRGLVGGGWVLSPLWN